MTQIYLGQGVVSDKEPVNYFCYAEFAHRYQFILIINSIDFMSFRLYKKINPIK